MVRRRFTHADPPVTDRLLCQVRTLARPLRTPGDLDPLLDRVGDARCVLFGEATHGTREFYTWRAEATRRLIAEKGFSFVAVEGDWPDCDRVNRFVKGAADLGENAAAVLHAFDRWPTWMWANKEVAGFADWLRAFNRHQPADRAVGFYGLDVYSLWDSLYEVMGYLRRTDGSALEAARRAVRCFQPYGEDSHEYARATRWLPETCEQEVVGLLRAMLGRAAAAGEDRDARFAAEQNALVLKNAEAYYRTMVRGRAESWNVRDRHMAETLDRLFAHHGPAAKGVVWEHNTHVGDARFTDMADDGMVNLGQLAREQHGERSVVLVGFGTHSGSVVAGAEWDAAMERMPVPPGREGSWEDVLHRAGIGDAVLVFDPAAGGELAEWRGHRAIGVVYDPDAERYGNYVPTVLPRRYDAFLYLDRTRALRPLHVELHDDGEVPETFPSGV
ncbi:MAG: erythromycin esterase family protein [Gemmataceae bacterium]